MNNRQIHIASVENVYFIGIGGIGMSALARYFRKTKNVAGYDKTPSPNTDMLADEGIAIHFQDNIDLLPDSFLDKDKTVVVYTPAVPSTHKELNYFIHNNYVVVKRAQMLGAITESTFCFGVAGTHGKTTTSSILGHIMESVKATSFLGGIAENYKSNLILGDTKVSVVEADEFDRSFLQLSPNIACITSMDADHLDIYGEHKELLDSFKAFSDKVSDTMIVAKGVELDGLTYAIEEEADYKACNLKIVNGAYIFDVITPSLKIEQIEFNLPGRHNIMNALASIAMADVYGVSHDVIKERLESFKGVERRFSYCVKNENVVLIDDYAHHPTEIKSVYNSVREMYPGKQILAIFQPHLFTRTRDFADDFAEALSKFDELLLLDIYPARELPIKGVTSSWLLSKMDGYGKKITTKQNLVSDVLASDAGVVLMLGAGDIGLLVNDVKRVLENN